MVTVGSFLKGKLAWNKKLFTLLHLVPMLRICGAILHTAILLSSRYLTIFFGIDAMAWDCRMTNDEE
jgi:hypothetical protein